LTSTNSAHALGNLRPLPDFKAYFLLPFQARQQIQPH